jgi:hypothetical protein
VPAPHRCIPPLHPHRCSSSLHLIAAPHHCTPTAAPHHCPLHPTAAPHHCPPPLRPTAAPRRCAPPPHLITSVITAPHHSTSSLHLITEGAARRGRRSRCCASTRSRCSRSGPARPGRRRVLVLSHSKSVLHGAFVWACWALSSRQRTFQLTFQLTFTVRLGRCSTCSSWTRSTSGRSRPTRPASLWLGRIVALYHRSST